MNCRNKIFKYNYTLLFILCVCPVISFTQQPTVQTTIDKNNILIGEQIHYKIKVNFNKNIFNANWFALPDSVNHFDIIEKSKIDTSTQNNLTILQQTITLTSFDSGKWQTPQLPINFTTLNNNNGIKIFTDSFVVNVAYVVDSTNQLKDIKPIIEVSVKDNFWYYVIGSVLILTLLTFITWRYLKNKKATPSLPFNSKISAYDEAMAQLEKLKTLNLKNITEQKLYYTKLTKIFKIFYSRVYKKSGLNKTTDDILIELSKNNLSKEIITNVATTLRCSDAAKFAKYQPSNIEDEDCFSKIKSAIHFIHQNKNTSL